MTTRIAKFNRHNIQHLETVKTFLKKKLTDYNITTARLEVKTQYGDDSFLGPTNASVYIVNRGDRTTHYDLDPQTRKKINLSLSGKFGSEFRAAIQP